MAEGTPYRDVSVARLIEATGMARSTFYAYFKDKAALLHALSASTLTRLYAPQREWLHRGPDVTPADVQAGMRELLDRFLDDEVVLRAVGEASVYEPTIRDAYVSSVDDYARALERFIRRGQKEGWARDVRPADTADALAWMTERAVSRVRPGTSARRLDSIAASLADVVCSTLLVRP
jgi:AcrR family transcriptional regulator